jgi:dihydroneopterin aldolase
MDKVFIKDLLVRGIIGIYDWEREQPQDILINITLFTDTRPAAASDNIDDCINYQTVAEQVKAHAQQAAPQTVEALAGQIATLCLQTNRVEKVIVRVEKPGVLPGVASVGVEIERP